MKNKYYITLVAGSRVNGMPKFGSKTEESQHELHLLQLQKELNRPIKYHSSLGTIEVELTDEEYLSYSDDHRVYDISINEMPLLCSTKFVDYDITQNNQWHLKQVSNNLFAKTIVLCGFKLELQEYIHGVPGVESVSINHGIVITNEQNKLVHNSQVYSLDVLNPPTEVLHIFSTNGVVTGYDVTNYVCYDYISDSFIVIDNPQSSHIPLYTVKIKHYYDAVTLWWTGIQAGVLGFYDLNPIIGLDEIYRCTLEGQGVDIIIGDAHINYDLEEFAGRIELGYNPYDSLFNQAYLSFDDDGHPSHGTISASIAMGATCGIARKAKCIGVTLFDFSEGENLDHSTVNASDQIMSGLNWIVSYIYEKKHTSVGKPYPIIVCLNLEYTGYNTAVDDAIASMITEGALVIIPAGNGDRFHAHSPYRPEALLVAASDYGVTASNFTDYGGHVDLYAPGSDIVCLMNNGTLVRKDGTSLAASIVAGLGSIFLSMYPDATPAELKRVLLGSAGNYVTFNKDATVSKFVQHPFYGYIDRSTIETSKLAQDLIYTAIPYYIGYDGEYDFGSKQELTLNNIASAVVSAGKSESTELATSFRLVP
jgi:hypothetical protein